MVYVGTAGYSYKDWIGPFYPESIKSGLMLEYYASQFDFVEINSSYYHMPSIKLFDGMNKRTSESFKFSIKIYSGFTHERNADVKKAEHFIYAVSPLIESNKLTCILAQFPYSFHYKSENMEYLRRLGEWFRDISINVEFRNQNWIREDAIRLLKKEGMGFVCVDEPNIKGLIGNVLAVTSPIAYVRMHGRNNEKWYGGEGAERYNYRYSRNELIEWVTKIKELEDKSNLTIVSFNNHPLGKATENAKVLKELLNNIK